MGVRFYDKENMSNGDNPTTTTRINCNCNICNLLPFSTTTTSSTYATQTTSNLNNGPSISFQKSGTLREIVGNYKEMRIEDNIHNLRIVGNNNRIRIAVNVGDIIIIGNNTRLKIKINHGIIKYTGNNGRISLGKESTEQLVDYSGCNGVLKVKNSGKSSQKNEDDVDEEINNPSTMESTGFDNQLNDRTKEKYASFSGSSSISEVFKCHNKFNRKRSMPNITTNLFNSDNVSSNRVQPRSIVPNFGNIVIANSSNICISPYTHIY